MHNIRQNLLLAFVYNARDALRLRRVAL